MSSLEPISATGEGHRALKRSWFEDRQAVDALRPVLKLPRPSRFRLLSVVCKQQHPLLMIYKTVAGPVYVGKAAFEWKRPDSVRFEPRTRKVVGRLDRQAWQQRSVPFDEVVASVGCRCRTAEIPLEWIEVQLAEGRPRVVWVDPVKR